MTAPASQPHVCWRAQHPVGENDISCGECVTTSGEVTRLRFGDYRVECHLGMGNYADVYRARHRETGELRAVKAFKAGLSEAAAEEFRVQQELDHPNIVKVYEFDPSEGFLVMEYMDGGSLEKRLEESPDEVRAAFGSIAVQVADALRLAHSRPLIHRDVKPANILTTRDMTVVKISDFGIARVLDESDPHTRSPLGSPGYMSPEALRGEPQDTMSDMFSLGATLYCIWAGAPPYGAHSPIAASIQMQAGEPYIPLEKVNPRTPEAAAKLIMQLLSTKGPRPSAGMVRLLFSPRDPEAPLEAIDDYHELVSRIYGLQNGQLTPLLHVTRYLTSVEGIVGGMRDDDSDYGRARAESYFVKGFAWLAGVLTRLDLSFSQLVAFKFEDGRCPYCSSCPCACAQSPARTRQEMNERLLAELRAALGPRGITGLSFDPARTFASVQETFAAIYGARNRERGIDRVALDALSSVSQALDALMRLHPSEERARVDILHLELADLVAWFFALLTLYQDDHGFDFERAFAETYSGGCPTCGKRICECADLQAEERLVNWRTSFER